MAFPAFEWIRFSLKWNISAARKQWGLGRLQLKCSMGRMECYKRDAYHVGKHSRPTSRLAHIINYLFVYLFTYLLSDRLSFARELASFRCAFVCFRIIILNLPCFVGTFFCLVNVATETFEPCNLLRDGLFRAWAMDPTQISCRVFSLLLFLAGLFWTPFWQYIL